MPKPFGYEPVLSAKAAATLVGLSKAKQKRIISLLFQLAEHPSQLGDYGTRATHDREIQHLKVGDWHFSYWADHAVRELRVTEITEL